MDAMDAIMKRRSVRSFTATPVPVKIIEKIVDAGRLAPTARNVQPWEFEIGRASCRERVFRAV